MRKANKEREEIGAQLYNFQQELGKLQASVTKCQGSVEEARVERERAETETATVKSEFTTLTNKVVEERAKTAEFKKEFEQLSATVAQLEAHHGELKSKLAVSKRETFKAEEDANKFETMKQEQDLLIDKLNLQIKQTEDRLAFVEAQLIAQKKETEAAAETLKEASKGMEDIQHDKKMLLQRWKSSIIAIAKRDEMQHAKDEEIK